MSREQALQGIILKKQAFRETDEIVTLYSKELGKVRLVARAIKKPTSKLQYSLQLLSEVEVRTASGAGGMPTITQAQVLRTFARLREVGYLVTAFFWMAEVVLKATPDEEPNERLYLALKQSLDVLDSNRQVSASVVVCKFALELLSAIGLSVTLPEAKPEVMIYFSNNAGGFTNNPGGDAVVVSTTTLVVARKLASVSFTDLTDFRDDTTGLHELLLGFVSYQLERRVNSERFLKH